MSNPFKTTSFRWNLGASIFILCTIAILIKSFSQRASAITISGLNLGQSYQEVIAKLGKPTFKVGYPQPTRIEYWNNKSKGGPSLYVVFNESQRAIEIGGGKPEINGKSAASLSLNDIKNILGSPAEESQSQHYPTSKASSQSADSYLKYPNYRLLVRKSPRLPIEFIVFNGSSH